MSTTTDKNKEVSDTREEELVDELLAMGRDADEVECLRGNHPEEPDERYEQYVMKWLSSYSIPGWARGGDVRLFTPGSAMFGVVLGEKRGYEEVVSNLSYVAGISQEDFVAMPTLFANLVGDYWVSLIPVSDGVKLQVVSDSGETYHQTAQDTRLDWLDEQSKQAQWLPKFSKTLYTMFFEDDDEFEDEEALRFKLGFRFECIKSVFDRDDSVQDWFVSPVSNGLVSATESVQAVHTEDGYEHRVTLTAPVESGLAPGTTATLTFDGSAWGTKSADSVRSEYLTHFAEDLELSDEMALQVFASWDAMKEVRTPADLARETLVDSFMSAINGLSVTAADALDAWESAAPAGILFEDSDGEDYIAVGSVWADDVVGDEARELPRTMPEILHEEGVVSEYGRASGVLYKALQDADVDTPRSSVLLVPIGKTTQDAAEIRAVADPDDDLTVEL